MLLNAVVMNFTISLFLKIFSIMQSVHSVTDENLSILTSKCAKNEMITYSLSWEKFQEGVGSVPVRTNLNGLNQQ